MKDYRAPRWPEDPSLVHIDFFVDDLEEAGAPAVRSGAHRFDHQPNAAIVSFSQIPLATPSASR